MSRNKEFDTDDIIEKSIEIFWKYGYKNTSMAYLLKNLSIGQGSFYNAFRSKHSLYLTALDHYSVIMLRQLDEILKQRPLKDTLYGLYQTIVDSVIKDKKNRGCLMTNAVTELASTDSEVANRVNMYYQNCIQYISNALSLAVEDGEISLKEPPLATALFLVNTMDGLRVMAKQSHDRSQLDSIIRISLSLI